MTSHASIRIHNQPSSGSGNVGNVVPFTYAGSSGAFTYEVLVHVAFNPRNNYSINPARNQPFQIVNCDADSIGTRAFQFHLDPVGFVTGINRDTNSVGVEFIGTSSGITTVGAAPIPTNQRPRQAAIPKTGKFYNCYRWCEG